MKTWTDEDTGLTWITGNRKGTCIDMYINDMNEEEFGGFKDWRLPTKKECISLLDPNKNGSSLMKDIAIKHLKQVDNNYIFKTRSNEYEKIFSFFYGSDSRFYPNCSPTIRLVRGKIKR